MAFLIAITSFNNSCDLVTNQEETKKSEIILSNVMVRVINGYDRIMLRPRTDYYISGKMRNIGSAVADNIRIKFELTNNAGDLLTYQIPNEDGNLRDYYEDIDLTLVVDNGIYLAWGSALSGKLDPGSEGWFDLTIGNYDGKIETFSYSHEWQDCEYDNRSTLVSSLTFINENFEFTWAEHYWSNNIEIHNQGAVPVHDIYLALAAVAENDNLLYVYTPYKEGKAKLDLPKVEYCYTDEWESMIKCLPPGQRVETEIRIYDNNFPFDKIDHWETKFFWKERTIEIPPVSGETTFEVISQNPNGCARFLRHNSNQSFKIFKGCGFSYSFRGFNYALINPLNGTLIDFMTFDTWNEQDADDRMMEYVKNIPDKTIILAAIADEGTAYLSDEARQVIAEELGSQLISEIGFRDGWALICVKGTGTLEEKMGDYTQEDFFQEARASLKLKLPLN